MRDFVRVLLSHHIVINSLRISLLVGTLLNMINQGSQILNGLEIAWELVLLNFVVPYCVASYSAAKNEIERINSE